MPERANSRGFLNPWYSSAPHTSAVCKDGNRQRPYLFNTHRSPLIAHRVPSKFFTKPNFRINPAGKSKVPSWKIFISQLENYFFSVGKSKFRSRAILGDCLGLFLNYFKRFLFILTPMRGLWTKVKIFDIGRWAMSCEWWVMSFWGWGLPFRVFADAIIMWK